MLTSFLLALKWLDSTTVTVNIYIKGSKYSATTVNVVKRYILYCYAVIKWYFTTIATINMYKSNTLYYDVVVNLYLCYQTMNIIIIIIIVVVE